MLSVPTLRAGSEVSGLAGARQCRHTISQIYSLLFIEPSYLSYFFSSKIICTNSSLDRTSKMPSQAITINASLSNPTVYRATLITRGCAMTSWADGLREVLFLY